MLDGRRDPQLDRWSNTTLPVTLPALRDFKHASESLAIMFCPIKLSRLLLFDFLITIGDYGFVWFIAHSKTSVKFEL